MESIDAAFRYHEATKHHPNRYARSAGYLDWANQPDPFRTYPGAAQFALPLFFDRPTTPYDALFDPGAITAQPLTVRSISLFFECSLAISAWKQYGDNRWALRCNPSSGNLHPTEGYLICNRVEGLAETPAVYHYAPLHHTLECRRSFSKNSWDELTSGMGPEVALVGLTSVHWREAWKYGERAYRYCQHDVGHAIAALRFAAALIGRRLVWLPSITDRQAAALLGIDREDDYHAEEHETADLILGLLPANASPASLFNASATDALPAGEWHGSASKLSPNHVAWDLIHRTAAACTRELPFFADAPKRVAADNARETSCAQTAYRIIQQRRSAVSFDGRSGISATLLYRMLARTLPEITPVPWDALPDQPRIHLVIFAHRVDGLRRGIYFCARNEESLAALQPEMDPSFLWQRAPGCPESLGFYLLKPMQCEDIAAHISCDQDIAGDSAFSLAMLADFEVPIRKFGAWYYRRLFWESGMVGQTLYLEAEAAGVRATGIGCYFDDLLHGLLGLRGRRFQSLYHFTVGTPVDDTRLLTLAPYAANRME